MNRSLQRKNMPVKTSLRAGAWWAPQCLKDHPDLYSCCVPGATPPTCNSCVEECKLANAGWDYDENSLHQCMLNANCFG